MENPEDLSINSLNRHHLFADGLFRKKHISMFWAFLICHINLQSNFGGNPGKKKQSFRFPTRGFIAIIISHI